MMQKYNINQTTLRIVGLYRSDYLKSLHVREIARETGVDVKAIHLQLKRLEKANVLSSTLKGRNKEYSLNLSNLLTKYYLVLAEAYASITYLGKNFLVKRIIDELSEQIEGVIILFGSYAKGQTTGESDIDLFIITEEEVAVDVAKEIGDLTGRDINIKSANKMRFLRGLERNDPLMKEVVSDHIVLKRIDNFCDTLWYFYARPR